MERGAVSDKEVEPKGNVVLQSRLWLWFALAGNLTSSVAMVYWIGETVDIGNKFSLIKRVNLSLHALLIATAITLVFLPFYCFGNFIINSDNRNSESDGVTKKKKGEISRKEEEEAVEHSPSFEEVEKSDASIFQTKNNDKIISLDQPVTTEQKIDDKEEKVENDQKIEIKPWVIEWSAISRALFSIQGVAAATFIIALLVNNISWQMNIVVQIVAFSIACIAGVAPYRSTKNGLLKHNLSTQNSLLKDSQCLNNRSSELSGDSQQTNQTSKQSGDIFTRSTKIIESITGAACNIFLFTQIFSFIDPFATGNVCFNFSYFGICLGAILGFVSAVAAAFCHAVFNANHEGVETEQSSNDVRGTLRYWQYPFLPLHFLTDMCEVAEPIILTFQIATGYSVFSNNSFGLGVMSFAILLGILASVSPCLTSANQIRKYNKRHSDDENTLGHAFKMVFA